LFFDLTACGFNKEEPIDHSSFKNYLESNVDPETGLLLSASENWWINFRIIRCVAECIFYNSNLFSIDQL
jgi:hypothetical protein